MFDPYEMLGVARDADKKAVRKAYIKKAKTMHPDAGGDNESFRQLVLAYQVLSDDDRRARYDSTGTIDEQSIGQEQAAILNLFAGYLDRIIGAGASAFTQDCVKLIRDGLNQEITALTGQMEQIKTAAAQVEKLRARFKVKAGRNILGDMLAEKARQIAAGKAQTKANIAIRKKAIEQLKDATFDFDAPQPMTQMYSQAGLGAFAELFGHAQAGMRR